LSNHFVLSLSQIWVNKFTDWA